MLTSSSLLLVESCNELANNAQQIKGVNISFVELLLSTFLGFISALLVETLWHYIQESQARKTLIAELYQELICLRNQINSMNKNMTYVRPYSIPVWRSACASGAISCLYTRREFSAYVDAYSYIEEANCVELEFFLKISDDITSKRETILLQLLNESRNKVKEKIDKALSDRGVR